MYQKILVPTDGSALADQAVSAAIDYARCAGAVVVAFSVAQPYPMLPMVDGAMMIDPVVDSAELQRLAQQAVDAIARTAQAAGSPARRILRCRSSPTKKSSAPPANTAATSFSWPRTAGAG